MTIRCPYCQNALGMKGSKPGRFTPRCPNCRKKFALVVPDDPSQPPAVSALPPEAATLTGTPGPGDAEESSEPDAGMSGAPKRLGDYRLLKLLGRGGMGAVYLARQALGGRTVALKVMRPDWALNPIYVSRLTREAFAAAQVRHHNLLPILDFGEDKGTVFFATGYVPGRSLAELVNPDTRLEPEAAAGYILQAARGLKHAHDQGLVHRDVKPANLFLDGQGVVKVADLGLTKTPALAEVEAAVQGCVTTVTRSSAKTMTAGGGPIDLVNVAMGTPAFMPPEQALNALNVDGRADLYSLGCTLYLLLTGRPPFEGKTAVELIAKHQTEPIVPPEMVVGRVPKALSEIVVRMTAKRPEDRYADHGELIPALEGVLGLAGPGGFSPPAELAPQWLVYAETYQNAPSSLLKKRTLAIASGGCLLFFLLAALARQPALAGGVFGLGAMTALAYFVVNGLRRPSFVFDKARELLAGGTATDWLVLVAVVVLLVLLLVVFHMLWGWVFFGVVAVLAAVAVHLKIDGPLDDERLESVEKARATLRGLRLRGVDEDVLRAFVRRSSGSRWEEFFEALFGYEALLDARRRWGGGGRWSVLDRHAPWRDPIVAWIDAKLQARRRARDTLFLQTIEEKALESQGVNLLTARRKAHRVAQAMAAAAERTAATPHFAAPDGWTPPPIGKAVREAARAPESALEEHEPGLIGRRWSWPPLVAPVVGPKARFLAGALLLAGFLAWVRQNEIVTREHLVKLREAAIKAAETRDVKALGDAGIAIDLDKPTKALAVDLPRIPAASPVLGLFNGFGPGVAGLILLVSSGFRGVRVGLGAIAGAAVAWLGAALGVPRVGPLDPSAVSMIAGGAIGLLAVLFGRGR